MEFATSSYSQFGEDVIIMKLFSEVLKIKQPTFIDIGAHHPYEISNTAIFYEKGCKGIDIEANPNLFSLFEKERPHSINICCGVADKKSDGSTMPFYMIDEKSGRNSFDKSLVDGFIRDNPSFRIQEIKQIPVKSLETILKENNIYKCPEYMSIDIEGMEFEVLKDFDLKNRGPKVITIEISSYSNKSKLLKEFLERSGYFLWLKIYHNYTFCKNEYKDRVL